MVTEKQVYHEDGIPCWTLLSLGSAVGDHSFCLMQGPGQINNPSKVCNEASFTCGSVWNHRVWHPVMFGGEPGGLDGTSYWWFVWLPVLKQQLGVGLTRKPLSSHHVSMIPSPCLGPGQPGPVIFPRLNMCEISSGVHSYQVPICQISGGRYKQLLVDLPEDRRSYEFCTKWLFATRPDRNSHPPDLRSAVCLPVVPTRMLFIRHYNQCSTVTWPFKLCSLLLFTSLPLETWLCQGIKLGLALNP